MTMIRILLLVLAALFSLGAAGDFPVVSQCRTDMYLLPMPGTPHDDAQEIALIPAATTTFRLCYDTSPGTLCGGASFATGGPTGQAVTGDTRGEFQLTSLAGATKYFWRVECSEDGGWKKGWEGSFVTTPSTDGEVRLAISTDNHFMGTWAGDYPDHDAPRILQFKRGVHLIAQEQNLHGHIDLGDGVYFQGKFSNGWLDTDESGRRFGHGSTDSYATSEAEALEFGEARAAQYLRAWWPALRFLPSIWARGNHDVGARFGDNGNSAVGLSSGHMQWREITPWVETGITVTLPGDLAADGIFTAPGHGMGDTDGPYRWAPINDELYGGMPILDGCTGVRDVDDYSNEWYVDYVDAGTFRLSLNDTDPGCNGTPFRYGSGDWTLVRGSNMQHTTGEVRLKYMPNHNEVLAHGWGPAEKGIMGPIRFSDYVVVLHLDEYEYTREDGPGGFPYGNRLDGPSGGWGLGPEQRAGALALISDLGPGSVGGYGGVEILIVAMHHTLGGHGGGYPYGRGTLCEPDTRYLDDKARECTQYSGTYGRCEYPRCDEDFAHDGWQNLHDAMDAFVTRASGVALVAVGHDHQCAGGKKDGVFYYTAGELNGAAGGWIIDEEHMSRHDFDGDGWPAYYKSKGRMGLGAQYSTNQNFPTEFGTDLDGFARLTMCPSSGTDACGSGKPEVQLDYIINAEDDHLDSHGDTEFSFTLQGP